MNDIVVPRWEWRTFDGDLAFTAARLANLVPMGTEESYEVYLLSSLCDANVKIRDGLIDIKRLEQIDLDGLELWRPVLKAGFSLPAKTVALVFQALAIVLEGLRVGCGELRTETFVDYLRALLAGRHESLSISECEMASLY